MVRKMKVLFSSFLLAGVLLASEADDGTKPRIWVSNDGRPIEGLYLRANSQAVIIKRNDGKEVALPLRFLSAADREWVQLKLDTEAKTSTPEEKVKAHMKYKLSAGSEKWPEDRRKRITEAMDAAVECYKRKGAFQKDPTANDSPGTPTADANYDGWINFGGSINRRVALHEIGHTLGIGTHANWQANIKDGKWTGKHALEQLREFDGKDAVLHADRMHFWPYGLNFDNESSKENDLRHVLMVAAMRKDMGID